MFEECYLQQLLIKILAKASVNAAVPEKFPVIVREGVNEQGEKLRFYLNYSWEEQRVEVADDFEVVLGNGDSTKHEIYLSAWDVCIIKFENKKLCNKQTPRQQARGSFISFSFFRMELNSVKKVIVVTAAAMISLTGSARNTANYLFVEEIRQDKDQRYQQDNLTKAGKQQADLCLSESHKALLAAYLETKREDSGHVDAERQAEYVTSSLSEVKIVANAFGKIITTSQNAVV